MKLFSNYVSKKALREEVRRLKNQLMKPTENYFVKVTQKEIHRFGMSGTFPGDFPKDMIPSSMICSNADEIAKLFKFEEMQDFDGESNIHFRATISYVDE